MEARQPLQVPVPDGNEERYGRRLHRSLPHRKLRTGMLKLHGQHPEMAQQRMVRIFPSSHHQNKSYPDQIRSDAELSHNLYGLRYPITRPSRMGTGTRYR